MQLYSCSGSLGDTLINILKIWSYVKKGDTIKHYTIHKEYFKLIKQLYTLLPVDVNVDIVNKESTEGIRLYSCFSLVDEKPFSFKSFPTFNLPTTTHELENNYTVICPKTGRKSQKHRIIHNDKLKSLIYYKENPVIIGKGIHCDYNCKNLIGDTDLLEALTIISNAKEFHSFQGLFCYFALSQKINTYVYIKDDTDKQAFEIRCCPEWKPYIKGVIKT